MLKTAKCTCCHTVAPVSEMIATKMPKRGNAAAYMCRQCATINRSYHAVNDIVAGTKKVNNVMVGIEFETSYTNETARNILFEYDFIPTHDCSLVSDSNENRYHGGWSEDGTTCEYVSGIIRGLNQPSKFAVTCQTLIDNGDMKVNDSCGTHFHVSINSMKDENGNKTYMGYIRRFMHTLFVPLSETMLENAVATEKLFGRYFNSHYAHAINANSNDFDRYNFINLVNDSNIEFRLNKFDNAKQYQELMKMEVDMVKCIIKNFCEHFNNIDFDRSRYENQTAYRKHKAQVTAKKLVKLFEKYANKF